MGVPHRVAREVTRLVDYYLKDCGEGRRLYLHPGGLDQVSELDFAIVPLPVRPEDLEVYGTESRYRVDLTARRHRRREEGRWGHWQEGSRIAPFELHLANGGLMNPVLDEGVRMRPSGEIACPAT